VKLFLNKALVTIRPMARPVTIIDETPARREFSGKDSS
jgi:hypothetical protein